MAYSFFYQEWEQIQISKKQTKNEKRIFQLPPTIGEQLQKTRLKNRVTFDDLSDMLQISKGKLSEYEHGTKIPVGKDEQVIKNYIE